MRSKMTDSFHNVIDILLQAITCQYSIKKYFLYFFFQITAPQNAQAAGDEENIEGFQQMTKI